MHIARIRHLFYPDMPRDYFYELSSQQTSTGHKVDVITWRRKGGNFQEQVIEGFTIHRLRGLDFGGISAIQSYPYLPGLPNELVRLKPDIVHGESHLFLPTVQAVKTAKKLGIPCVVTVHGVFADRGAIVNFAQHTYMYTLGLAVMKKADRVVCLTKSDAIEIEKLGCSSKKIRLIPNAVDTEFFRPGKIAEDNLVVWVGRFVPEKGINYLIDAVKIVTDENKDINFLLIGYGPQKSKMIKSAHNRGLLNKFIHFTKPLDRIEIAKILKRSSIFVLPSLKEGMPLALMEAMSSGNAIVASNISGVNDIINNYYNGILVSPRSPEKLASSILELAKNNKLRRKLSENARNTIKKNYSFHQILAMLDKLYESILS